MSWEAGSADTKKSLPEIETLRGAKLGDSRQTILQLYPEIDVAEEYERSGSHQDLWIEGSGGYLNLTFVFQNDRVVEIRTSIMID